MIMSFLSHISVVVFKQIREYSIAPCESGNYSCWWWMASRTSFRVEPDKAFAFDCKKEVTINVRHECDSQKLPTGCEKWWWGACSVSPSSAHSILSQAKSYYPCARCETSGCDVFSASQVPAKSNDPRPQSSFRYKMLSRKIDIYSP
jgi:hypothetical protein